MPQKLLTPSLRLAVAPRQALTARATSPPTFAFHKSTAASPALPLFILKNPAALGVADHELYDDKIARSALKGNRDENYASTSLYVFHSLYISPCISYFLTVLTGSTPTATNGHRES